MLCHTHGAVRIHLQLLEQAWSFWIKQHCTIRWETQANSSRHRLNLNHLWSMLLFSKDRFKVDQSTKLIFINFFKIWLGSCTIMWADFHNEHIWQTKIAVNYMELNTSLHIVTASLGLAIKLSGLGNLSYHCATPNRNLQIHQGPLPSTGWV